MLIATDQDKIKVFDAIRRLLLQDEIDSKEFLNAVDNLIADVMVSDYKGCQYCGLPGGH